MPVTQAVQQATNQAAKQASRRKWLNRATVAMFLLPALLIYGLYNVYGIIMTFFFSTLNWPGMGPYQNAISVGLQNYAALLHDQRFWHAASNNMLLVVVSVLIQLSFGMILALIINSKMKGSKVLRTVYFMPMLLSTVATGILWQLLLDPYNGMINGALRKMGYMNPPSWLGSESTVMFAVLFVVCWQYTPQYMILLRAGMSNIPEEVYEAATIDGASKWQQFTP
jgi:raffinose/stachyose/melibiose transport system permease protein